MTDPTLLLHALILGLVEGVTEFLPISRTGHLILAGQLLGFNGEKAKVFMIAIQLAAIMAVVWEYRVRLVGILGHVAVTLHSEPASRPPPTTATRTGSCSMPGAFPCSW